MKTKAFFRIYLYCFLLVLFSSLTFSQWVNTHESIYQGEFPIQQKGKIFVELNFKTNVIRVTDARKDGLPGIVPQYSKRQAWNSNESLLLLQTCSGRFMLYDDNYSFIRFLDDVYGEDVFWHPINPYIILFCPDSVLFSFNVQTNELSTIYAFTDYTFANTRGEGNLSNDGRYWAFVGQIYDNENGTRFKDIVVFDIIERKIITKMELPNNLSEFDWVSISPKGNYVIVDYATMKSGRYQGVEVYDKNLNFLWQKPLGAGHSDIGIDENGDEVLIIGYYDADSNETFIKKFRLSDGKETILLKHHWSFYNHISCRNFKRNEWCFVSTYDGEGRLTDDSLDWQPFEDEIFALRLDGSGDVQRLCHHRSRRFSPSTPDSDNSIYYAEPHSSVSPSGSRIVFGSNWRQNIEQDSSCDTYIIDLRNWLKINEHKEKILNDLDIDYYDNGYIHIKKNNLSVLKKIEIYNILGMNIGDFDINSSYFGDELLPISLNNGIYYIVIYLNDRTEVVKLIVLK